MSRKLRWWHARRRRVHTQRVSSRLEMWRRELAWTLGILCNNGDFDPKGRKVERFHRRSVPSAHVCAHLSSLQHFLTLTRPCILGNKRKRKEAEYIFIRQCCCLSLLCNTRWQQWKWRKSKNWENIWTEKCCGKEYNKVTLIYCILQPQLTVPSQLGLQNTLTASLQRDKTTHNECPSYDA